MFGILYAAMHVGTQREVRSSGKTVQDHQLMIIKLYMKKKCCRFPPCYDWLAF